MIWRVSVGSPIGTVVPSAEGVGGEAVRVGLQGLHEKFLHLPLNFAMNLKLF